MSQECLLKDFHSWLFFLFVIHNFQFISRLFSSLIIIRVLKNYVLKRLFPSFV